MIPTIANLRKSLLPRKLLLLQRRLPRKKVLTPMTAIVMSKSSKARKLLSLLPRRLLRRTVQTLMIATLMTAILIKSLLPRKLLLLRRRLLKRRVLTQTLMTATLMRSLHLRRLLLLRRRLLKRRVLTQTLMIAILRRSLLPRRRLQLLRRKLQRKKALTLMTMIVILMRSLLLRRRLPRKIAPTMMTRIWKMRAPKRKNRSLRLLLRPLLEVMERLVSSLLSPSRSTRPRKPFVLTSSSSVPSRR